MTEAKEFKMFKPEDLEINLYPRANKNWCLMELERKLTPLKTQTCPHCGHVMGYLEGVDFMFCHRCTKKYEVVK